MQNGRLLSPGEALLGPAGSPDLNKTERLSDYTELGLHEERTEQGQSGPFPSSPAVFSFQRQLPHRQAAHHTCPSGL